jgi:hypothetical protein
MPVRAPVSNLGEERRKTQIHRGQTSGAKYAPEQAMQKVRRTHQEQGMSTRW